MNFKTLIFRVFTIALCGTAVFSCYTKHQKKKLNYLILEKINNVEQEISIIKKQTADLKSKINTSSNKNLIRDDNKFNQFHLEGRSLLNLIDFESEVRSGITKFKNQSTIKKVIFPNHFFSEFEGKILYSKNVEKTMQQKQKEWILLKYILEKILTFPKSKIENFELKEVSNSGYFNNTILPLETLFIRIIIREDYFQKLFNTIINNNNFFIISSISISNNKPLPPLHHSLDSKDNLIPILGSENITASLRIDLFDMGNTAASLLQEIIKKDNTSSTNKLTWEYQQGGNPLFVSRHYATKNELILDPIDYPQMLFPPVTNKWLVSNNLDYSNPNILFEDIDKTGFTNLEKWLGDNPQEEPGKFSSDPNDPTSHPLLWTKLRCYQNDIISEINSIYFLGVEFNDNEIIFQIQPNIALESKNRHGKTIFDKKIRYVKMGEQINGLPYKIVNYQKKNTIYKKTYYDSSELTIENLNTRKRLVLIKKTPYHPEADQIVDINSVKVENTLFNPPNIINLKLKDYFSLDYVLPNSGLVDKKNIIETENYQLIDFNTREITIEKDTKRYKIPIISTVK